MAAASVAGIFRGWGAGVAMDGWARASEDKTTAGSAAVVAAMTGMLMVRFGERGVVMKCVLISNSGGGIVGAVVSVTNVADVINDANVISVNLSHLVDEHNNSCQTGQMATIDMAGIATGKALRTHRRRTPAMRRAGRRGNLVP